MRRSDRRPSLLLPALVAVLGAGCSAGAPDLERELARLEEEVEAGRRAERRLVELEREVAAVGAQLQQLETVLVTGEDDARVRLHRALVDSGFEAPELEPRGRGRLGDSPVLRLAVRTSVRAGTAGEALARLEEQPLLVVVEELSWSRGVEEDRDALSFVAALGLVEP